MCKKILFPMWIVHLVGCIWTKLGSGSVFPKNNTVKILKSQCPRKQTNHPPPLQRPLKISHVLKGLGQLQQQNLQCHSCKQSDNCGNFCLTKLRGDFSTKYRWIKEGYNNIFCLCVTLTNFHVSFHPLCDDDDASSLQSIQKPQLFHWQ